MIDSKVELMKNIINASDNIVFFGGAGVSTASGIKDFRGKHGLYKEQYDYPPEYLLSSRCFYKEPKVFYDFYKSKMNCITVEPNIVHYYLTRLENSRKLKAIITQNIDGLHQKAKSNNVIEIHGTIYKNHCIKCNKEYNAEYVFDSKDVPKCECGGIIKPDVVLYGEMLPECYSKAQYYIYKADTLIVAGTSLTVEPASGLVKLFNGKNLIIINNEKTPYDNLATLVINHDLSSVFNELLKMYD